MKPPRLVEGRYLINLKEGVPLRKKVLKARERLPLTLVSIRGSGRKFALLSGGLILILGAFWWYQSSQLSSGVQVETQEESTGKEPKQAESDAEESFLGVAADAPRDLQPAKPGEEAAQRYTIQVGAFGTEEAAQKMLSQLSAKGYSGRIEQPGRGADRYYHVWVGEFTSTEPASRFQTRLKADGFQVYLKRTAGQ